MNILRTTSVVLGVVFMSTVIAVTLIFSNLFLPTIALAQTLPVGPSISSISVTDITDTSARIDVNSDEMVQGYVEYGTSEEYGMSTPLTSEFTTSPTFLLENLTPETLYHYRVVVVDSAGTATITGDETFTTLTTPGPETPSNTEPEATSTATTTESTSTATSTPAAPAPPVISNVAVNPISTSTATVSWTTSKPATSDIRYGTTTSYGSSAGEDQTFNTTHTQIIHNLVPATLYHFRIVAEDTGGNVALGKDRTFTTENISSSNSVPETASTSTSATSSNEEILSNIAAQAAQAAAPASSGGGGGIPVAPTHPLLLKVTPLDGQVAFNWRKDSGGNNGTIHTLIVRKEGTDPVLSRIDGTIIYDGPSTTFTDTDVENGVEYHYALYSYGAYGRFTAAARFKVVPQAGEEQVDLSAEEAATNTAPILARDLHQGKQGDDVSTLQAYLAGHGYYPEALVTGYFGSLTKTAVMRYQKLNGIAPIAGYVGPITRGVLGQ